MKRKLQVAVFMLKKIYSFKPLYVYLQLLRAFLQIGQILSYVFFPSYILGIISTTHDSKQAFTSVVIVLIALFLLRSIIVMLTRSINSWTYEIQRMVFKEISLQLMDVPFELIEDPAFIQLKEEALFPMENQNALVSFFESIPKLFQSMFVLVGLLAIISSFDFVIIIMITAVTVLNILLNRYFISVETSQAKVNMRQNKEYVYYLRTMRDPMIAKDVRIYGLQDFFAERIRRVFDLYIKSGESLYGARDKRSLVNRFLSSSLSILMYGFLLFKIMNHQLDPAEFILLVNAAISFSEHIYLLFNEGVLLNQLLIYLDAYHRFDEQVHTIEHMGTHVLDDEIHTIEFKDVYFKYPSSDTYVLNGVCFKINNKQSLSIVGANGSGKTTIIKLLSGLYEPNKGVILINDIPMQELDYDVYLDALAIVFQDFKTFQYSLKENITIGEDNHSQLQKALDKSELTLELEKFPNGVDTSLARQFSKDAISLSKGQEQKLAIARSIYKQSSLMILDEPTASLDPIAEEEVYQNFYEITKDKLSVFISHRLSSCRFSDTIVLLENGTIKEQGNHDALVKLNGTYATMFNLQASKYQ